MSGECDKCGEHALECNCEPIYCCRYSGTEKRYDELPPTSVSFGNGIDPPSQLPLVNWVNVRGREQHESIINNAAKCKHLGLDQFYEIIVYLKRWGGWLSQ